MQFFLVGPEGGPHLANFPETCKFCSTGSNDNFPQCLANFEYFRGTFGYQDFYLRHFESKFSEFSEFLILRAFGASGLASAEFG